MSEAVAKRTNDMGSAAPSSLKITDEVCKLIYCAITYSMEGFIWRIRQLRIRQRINW